MTNCARPGDNPLAGFCLGHSMIRIPLSQVGTVEKFAQALEMNSSFQDGPRRG